MLFRETDLILGYLRGRHQHLIQILASVRCSVAMATAREIVPLLGALERILLGQA